MRAFARPSTSKFLRARMADFPKKKATFCLCTVLWILNLPHVLGSHTEINTRALTKVSSLNFHSIVGRMITVLL